MAFSTIQGSGGAPDSFVGTTGVDSIVIVNSDGNYFLGAQGANDIINTQTTTSALYGGVVSNATMKGGQGDDTFTFTAAAATFYSSAFINLNADADTFAAGVFNNFLASTIQGGKGDDEITLSSLTTSLVNGNKDTDLITVNAAAGASVGSSVLGGQGNDTLAVTGQFTNGLISGDLDIDRINLNTAVSYDGSTVLGGQGADVISIRGGAGDDAIFANGGEGADIMFGSDVNGVDVTLQGGEGDDRITSGVGTGTETIIGGFGNDVIAFNTGIDVLAYTALGQGGTALSATSATAVSAGDVITGFAKADDFVNFAAASLVGTAAVAGGGATGTWNLNTTGVFIYDTATTVTPGTTSANAIATAIGNVIGDAGDTAYFVTNSVIAGGAADAGTSSIFAVTLGSTRSTAGALNGGDSITLIGQVGTTDELTTAQFSFLG